MSKFKKGDRVVHEDYGPGTFMGGDGVVFDRHNGGLHTLGGVCEDGYGWHCSVENLEFEKPQTKVVINSSPDEQLVDSGHDQIWACDHCKYKSDCASRPGYDGGCAAHDGQYYAPDEEKHPKYIEIIRTGGNHSTHSRHQITNEKGDVFQVIEVSKDKSFKKKGLVCTNGDGEITVVHYESEFGDFHKEITKHQYESRLQSKSIPRAERRAALAEEAEDLGYLPGIEAKHLTTDKWCKITKTGFDYYNDSDSLYAKGEGYTVRIYKQGTWAEKREPAVKVEKAKGKPKKPSLLRGSIYHLNYRGDEWLMEFACWGDEKYDEICGNTISFDGSAYFDKDPDDNTWGALDENTTIRPATVEEMKWFMYCKQEDRFVAKADVPSDFMHKPKRIADKGVAKSIKDEVICETKTKQSKDMFKEGDYVWIHPDSQYYGAHSNQGSGGRGEIDSYYGHNSMTVAWENGDHNSYEEHDLTHSNPHIGRSDSHYRQYDQGEHLTIAGLTLRVAGSRGCWYLQNETGSDNNEVFNRLEISNKVGFITDIVGRDHALSGGFPEVRGLSDLSQVIHALQQRERKFRKRSEGPASQSMHSHESMMRRMSEQRFHPPSSRMHFIDHPGMHSMGRPDDHISGISFGGPMSISSKKAEEDDRGILITASQKKVIIKKKFKIETIEDDDIVE